MNIEIRRLMPDLLEDYLYFFENVAHEEKGIATQLLERVCKDAVDDGFDYIEAYPNKEFINMFRDFMGPYDLYKKLGFTVHEEMESIFVMRKYLK